MPRATMAPIHRYRHPTATPRRWVLSGTTRDANGVILPGCTVSVFETASKLFRAGTVSDANGHYSVDITEPPLAFFVACNLAGSPDVSGMSDWILTGSPG